MSTPVAEQSPYVGPAALEPGQPIFGRDAELRELSRRLQADRVVLLYAPSGAGKTSLIQAGLIPQQAKQSAILPVVRVSLSPPPGFKPTPGDNLHLLSALISLHSDQPTPLSPEALAQPDLIDYVNHRRTSHTHRDTLVIFDQFEEILTFDPLATAAKEAFFGQVGALLEDRNILAVFAMREDYVGSLGPYLYLLPSRLRSSFRLGLLERANAISAISKPAELRGVSFTPAALDALADQLCRVEVTRIDGTSAFDFGPAEPVQLQVICRDLWERLKPAPGTQIDKSDLGKHISFEQALRDYYDQSVLTAAGGGPGGAVERTIRAWIGRELVTAQGLRNQVLREPGIETAGLSNALIDKLLGVYLLRSDMRRGLSWVELAHDRMVGPVRDSNQAWSERHLAPLQRWAEIWQASGALNNDLLLRGDALREGEEWAAEHSANMSDTERRFLASSRQLQEQRDRDQRMRDSSLAQALAARAARLLRLGGGDERATLLAIQAFHFHLRSQSPAIDQVDAALRAVLSHDLFALRARLTFAILSLVISPDGALLAAGCDDGHLRLWDVRVPYQRPRTIAMPTERRNDALIAVDVSPDNARVAVGSESGYIYICALPSGNVASLGVDAQDVKVKPLPVAVHRLGVAALQFQPDGVLLSAGRDGQRLRWDLQSSAEPVALGRAGAALSAMTLRPGGADLACAADDRSVQLWSATAGPSATPRFQWQLPDLVGALAFSPEGDWLAAGGRNRRAFLIDLRSPRERVVELTDLRSGLVGLAFSPDGRRLAGAEAGGRIKLWAFPAPIGALHIANFPSSQVRAQELRGAQPINALARAPDGRRLAAGGPGQIQLWAIGRPPATPIELTAGAPVSALCFDAPGRRLFAASAAGNVMLWQLGGGAAAALAEETIGRHGLDALCLELGATPLRALALSPDGAMLAAATADGALLYDPQTLRHHPGPRLSVADPQIAALAFSPDGRWLGLAGLDPAITSADWRASQARRQLRPAGHSGAVAFLRLADDGAPRLLIGVSGANLFIWNAAAPEHAAPLSAAAPVIALALSPNERRLAAAGAGRSVQIWQLDQLDAAAATLYGPDAPVSALAFSPDGAALAAGCADGTIWIWQIARPTDPPVVLERHAASISALAFSPATPLLASADSAGSLRLWISDTATLAHMARGRAWRNLSRSEWRRLVGETTDYERTCADLPPGEEEA